MYIKCNIIWLSRFEEQMYVTHYYRVLNVQIWVVIVRILPMDWAKPRLEFWGLTTESSVKHELIISTSHLKWYLDQENTQKIKFS